MQTTTAIVDALVSKLEAVTWTPAGGSPEAAFEAVHRFDASDKQNAFKKLLVSASRVAIVIYMGEEWMDGETADTPRLLVLRSIEFLVLVSDRNLSQRDIATFGDGRHPGALGLKDAALPALAGSLIAPPDAINIRPTAARVEVVPGENIFTDRVFCSISLQATGGLLNATQYPTH